MERIGFLKKEKIEEYLQSLSKKGELYVPVDVGRAVKFEKYLTGSSICLDRPPTLPPKSVIYPQSERLFKFKFKKDEGNVDLIEIEEVEDTKKRIIFGARPCDSAGFSVIDNVFIQTDTPDVYYERRRMNSFIAAKACDKPSAGCFCIAVGGGPFDDSGSDALITELEEGYLIEAKTEKGSLFLDWELIEPGDDHLEKKLKKKEESERLLSEYLGELKKIEPLDPKTESFNDENFWKRHLSKCISCGLCTYLCPTCYCFNITDEKKIFEGERIRSWDSCMFFHFTLEASGHNPRPDKFKRFRNRVGHKFMFYPEKYSQLIACCGCGRCIRFCPVSVDIREVVFELQKPRRV